MLSDQPPVISFDKPVRSATNLEVFTQARAERLRRRLDGPPLLRQRRRRRKTDRLQLSRESARSLTGAYTFFLEEYNLKPGDFISYFAKARDDGESTSDIYFIEVN